MPPQSEDHEPLGNISVVQVEIVGPQSILSFAASWLVIPGIRSVPEHQHLFLSGGMDRRHPFVTALTSV